MDLATARRRVEAARVAVLATVGDREAHAVPCVLALADDTVYTPVDGKPKRHRALQRLRDLATVPRATVLVHGWSEDWSLLWWVQLRGPARILVDGEELAAARGLLVARYPQYRRPEELLPVIAVDVASWHTWEAAAADD